MVLKVDVRLILFSHHPVSCLRSFKTSKILTGPVRAGLSLNINACLITLDRLFVGGVLGGAGAETTPPVLLLGKPLVLILRELKSGNDPLTTGFGS